MVISGKLNEGVDERAANEEIEKIIQKTIDKGIQGDDLEKVKNQSESSHLFSQIEVLNRAMGLAFAAFLGNIDLVNIEQQYFRRVTEDEVVGAASRVLRPTNCSTLFYLPEN